MQLAADTPVTETELRDAHLTLTRILGAIEEYVYTGEFLPDDGYRVIFAGPCREQFLGLAIEQARTAVWRRYVHPDDVELFERAHADAHRTGRLDVEYRMVGADGVLRWVRDRGRIRREDGRRFIDGSILDVSEVHAAREELLAARAEAQRLARVDELTGVHNRRSLPDLFAASAGAPLGVLSLDLDRFKQINDVHGHAAGDDVLVAVAERLRAAIRAGDEIVRMGGEEFLLLLRDAPALADVTAIGEGVRRAIEQAPVATGAGPLDVTASIGAAHSCPQGDDHETALRDADRALYAAKREGRNRVHAARPSLRAA